MSRRCADADPVGLPYIRSCIAPDSHCRIAVGIGVSVGGVTASLNARSDAANEFEILVVRHEVGALRRTNQRPRLSPRLNWVDRACSARCAGCTGRSAPAAARFTPNTAALARPTVARRWTYPRQQPGSTTRHATPSDALVYPVRSYLGCALFSNANTQCKSLVGPGHQRLLLTRRIAAVWCCLVDPDRIRVSPMTVHRLGRQGVCAACLVLGALFTAACTGGTSGSASGGASTASGAGAGAGVSSSPTTSSGDGSGTSAAASGSATTGETGTASADTGGTVAPVRAVRLARGAAAPRPAGVLGPEAARTREVGPVRAVPARTAGLAAQTVARARCRTG